MDSRLVFGAMFVIESVLLQVNSTVYVSDPTHSKMVEFYSNNQPCRIVSDGESISSAVAHSDSNHIHTVSSEELDDLLRSCRGSGDFNKAGGFIFPGTKWCGPGNTAESFNDLGIKSDVDRCCREHDHCPMTLEPGQCRRGICNISPFTRSHCDCDNALKKCLRAVNSNDARIIGTLYFNVAQVTCFRDRRSCPPWMRNDLSYTWFCDEWKFIPMDSYASTREIETAASAAPSPGNDMTKGNISERRKPLEHSNIDYGLHDLYRADSDIEKMMDDPKSIQRNLKKK